MSRGEVHISDVRAGGGVSYHVTYHMIHFVFVTYLPKHNERQTPVKTLPSVFVRWWAVIMPIDHAAGHNFVTK